MSSDLDIYEQLFYAAQRDMRGREKNANLITDLWRGGRNWLNNTAPAKALNNSRVGQAVSSYADDALGLGDPLTRRGVEVAVPGSVRRSNAAAAARRKADEAIAAGNRADSAVAADWDNQFKSVTSPEQRQWAHAVSEKDMARLSGAESPGAQNATRSATPKTWEDELHERYIGAANQAQKAQSQARGYREAAESAQEEAARRISPLAAGGAAVGLGGAGVGGGYAYGKHKEEQKGRKNRNLAFGAGLAAGASAPTVYNNLEGAAENIFGRSSGPPPQNRRLSY